MIVVSDTSVLVNLAWLNRLDILPALYGEIVVPSAVWEEIVVLGAGKIGSQEIAHATWINRRNPKNESLIDSLRQTLDSGEAEGIALVSRNITLVVRNIKSQLQIELRGHLTRACTGPKAGASPC